jgi:hypothetical protein
MHSVICGSAGSFRKKLLVEFFPTVELSKKVWQAVYQASKQKKIASHMNIANGNIQRSKT